MTDDAERSTRDIAIATRQDVHSIDRKLDAFISEVRYDRKNANERLDMHEAIVNKARGAWWAVGLIGAISGWIGAHIPGGFK